MLLSVTLYYFLMLLHEASEFNVYEGGCIGVQPLRINVYEGGCIASDARLRLMND